MGYVFARLKESSTWRGLAMLATSLGVSLHPDQIAAIVTAGTALVGLIAVFFPDKVQA